jgi:hypothetical protein
MFESVRLIVVRHRSKFVIRCSGKSAFLLAGFVLLNLIVVSVWFVNHKPQDFESNGLNLIGAHNFSPLFHKDDKVLFVSKCDPATINNITRALSQPQIYFTLQGKSSYSTSLKLSMQHSRLL